MAKTLTAPHAARLTELAARRRGDGSAQCGPGVCALEDRFGADIALGADRTE
ncbi:hypothetical protein AB0I98_37890 [Streptomyces sp. NPDC050211]|uniref:hypothetical protein n=1 Tax=Streptomyces sp. NPDC050211 TaxID=3154932 RepID=UPI00343288D9